MASQLKTSEKASIVELYEKRLHEYGPSHKTVGWGKASDQTLRFVELFRGLDPTGARILDVGCGLGDLVPYLDTITGGDYDYLGVDIAPALINSAKRSFGNTNIHFESGNILEWKNDREFDIAVLSGALSFRVADNEALAKAVLTRMFEKTSHCVSANFLTSYVDYQLPKNFHYEPEKLFHFARSLSQRTRLNHDYPLYEFTLQIFHNQEPKQ